ncbi:DNA-3-methyladenine glycosylase 2 family protein [Parasphingorhabdus sp.]|jgi:DNA-3-methyladenine glycosylase II|uniref:DNA-3-methyladenine glycosylase family protein n=1 Tax=Parasphingorhabdus sp. TaxID=2709688 RepID=UPI0030960589|nr:DNA-3-methyladenine glycosylase 2 family protein [Sphingomonadales bacterium]
MGLSKETIQAGLNHVSAIEPRLAAAIAQSGYPEPRIRPEGYETLLRTIVGQQVSVASAAAVWNKLEARLGDGCPAEALIASEFDELRACGLSRQKQGYARSLAELILSGGLDLDNLPQDDETAIALLTKIKGIGRWSAEIYLLFAQGRPDIWPGGDLAIQVGVGNFLDLAERPSEKAVRQMAEAWSPHRGAVAIFTWHHYHVMVM